MRGQQNVKKDELSFLGGLCVPIIREMDGITNTSRSLLDLCHCMDLEGLFFCCRQQHHRCERCFRFDQGSEGSDSCWYLDWRQLFSKTAGSFCVLLRLTRLSAYLLLKLTCTTYNAWQQFHRKKKKLWGARGREISFWFPLRINIMLFCPLALFGLTFELYNNRYTYIPFFFSAICSFSILYSVKFIGM